VQQLGRGLTPCRLGRCVSNSSRRASSEPLPEQSESIEGAHEATSAGDTSRCASRGREETKKSSAASLELFL